MSIKTELDVLKQSQKKLKSRRKASRSTLHETPVDSRALNSLSKRDSVDDWYKAADVSVSSTGSEIRNRLQASLRMYPPETENFAPLHSTAPVFEDVSPIGYFGEEQVMPCATPAWVSRNPHLATLFDPAAVAMQLPPLFRTPISSGSSSPLVNWTIPAPVLFGLGGKR